MTPKRLMRLMPVAALLLMTAWGTVSCGHGKGEGPDTTAWDYVSPPPLASNPNIAGEENMGLIEGAPIHRLPTFIERVPLTQLFNDSNALQLQAARANGFEPVTDLAGAYNINKPLIRVYSCDAYMLDELKMSVPYLVPKAAQLLKEMGYAFQDSVRSRGGKSYRMKVTSVTRTDYSVSQLQRRNRWASSNSCHRYGTTFDISWVKFDCLDPSMVVSLEDLKNILAEVVADFRNSGRCYAIFERKAGCFHITVR